MRSNLLENLAIIAFYVWIAGNIFMFGRFMVHFLKQTGGFPSSHGELNKMAERVDKDEMAMRAKKYKKHMVILSIVCFGIIIGTSIVNAWIK